MSSEEYVVVRFHYGGEFVREGGKLSWSGGEEAESLIERDKLSISELKGYLKDHTPMEFSTLRWLYPRKEVDDGLIELEYDKDVLFMASCISECGVADVYAEAEAVTPDEAEDGDYKDEIEEEDLLSDNDEEDEATPPRPVMHKMPSSVVCHWPLPASLHQGYITSRVGGILIQLWKRMRKVMVVVVVVLLLLILMQLHKRMRKVMVILMHQKRMRRQYKSMNC